MKSLIETNALNQGEYSNFLEKIQREATDADQHAHNLTNWQQQYDQVSSGNFYGQITELQFTGLQIFQEHTSQSLRQTCRTWDKSLWLGIPVNKIQDSKINGLNIRENHIMCRPGETQFELMTPHNFDIYGLVVEQDKIQSMAEKQNIAIDWSLLHQQSRLTLPEKTMTALRLVLNNLLTHPNNQHKPEKLQHDIIMMTLLESIEHSQPVKSEPVSFFRRQQIVEQVKEYLDNHQSCTVTIADLCALCSVSRRTLQYSFATILGISPLRYLRLSRLNGIRRELLTSKDVAIADIAAKWGFWHLSQFAQDYKQLFNELPSVTLSKQDQPFKKISMYHRKH